MSDSVHYVGTAGIAGVFYADDRLGPFRIVSGQKIHRKFGLLSSDTKAETQSSQDNLQSYGLFNRNVLRESPLITVPESALKAGGPPAWQASKHVSSSGVDRLEILPTANIRMVAIASGVCGETSFMNGAGDAGNQMPGLNGNIRSFRFMPAAFQR